MPLTKISTHGITDGTIVNTDVSSTAAIATSKLGAGAVLQIVFGEYATGVITTSSSYVDTNVSASITPSSSSNKILIVYDINSLSASTSTTGAGIALYRNSTAIYSSDAYAGYSASGGLIYANSSGNYFDSPSTTSSTTYSLKVKRSIGSGNIEVQTNGISSSITLMEIKA